jgi:molybdopterin-containing oxidoreductase family membrane subunit
MKKIIYSEVANNGVGFYGLLGIIGVFLLGGAIAFFTMEHHGHYISGMNNQIVWGIPHVFAIFMIVAASGALNVGSIGTVFGRKIYQPLGRLSGLLAIALLLGGLTVLVLDLGRPDRLIVAMTTYNFKSIFAWNIILYNGFLGLVILYLWGMMDRKAKALYKPVGFAAFTWRLILTLGTGSIFGFLVGRQSYDAAILGPEFVILSFSLGLAIFIMILMASYKWTGRELGDVVLHKLRNLLGVFILAVILFEAIRHLTNLYATEHHGVEAFFLNGESTYSKLFWFGYVILGSLIPLFLVFVCKLKNSRAVIFLASALVALGGFILIGVILIGGQAYPLVLFPNATVESSFYDGVINTYSPSIWEIMLGLGGIAVMLLIVVMATKALRFLPVSLADSVVDPHAK